jgi:hypothetical protein
VKDSDLNLAAACQNSAMCPIRFGALKRQIRGVSAKVLTERLRMMELRDVVYRAYEPTVPPQEAADKEHVSGRRSSALLRRLPGLGRRTLSDGKRV